LVLGCGYLFTGCMVIPHTLSYPGLFAEFGLLPSSGPKTTAWLYMFWHAGFPLVVIGYAFLKDDVTAQRAARDDRGSSRSAIIAGIGIVLSAVAAVMMLATYGSDLLPPLVYNNRYTIQMNYVSVACWALCPIALSVLWRRRPHSVLDVWLMVVLFAWLCDVALS